MKYKLTESAKYKYQIAMLTVVAISLPAIFVLQGLGVI